MDTSSLIMIALAMVLTLTAYLRGGLHFQGLQRAGGMLWTNLLLLLASFVVAGMGTLESVSRFLWQIETTTMPIKIMDMQVGSTNETGQSMSLQLRLLALCLSSEPKASQNELQEELQEINDEI